MKHFVIILCLFSPIIIFAHENQPQLEEVTLQLKWHHQFQFAGYYAAIEKGFYAEEGLKVNLRDINPKEDYYKIIRDNPDIQYAISDSALLLYYLKGDPFVVIASIFQHTPMVFIAHANSGILGPNDFKGRKIMMNYGNNDAPLTSLLHQSGITKLNTVILPHSYSTSEFERQEIDLISSYITDSPYIYKKKGIPINIINPMNYGIDFYGDVLFTKQEEIEKHPERVKKFRRATLKGWEYALNNKNQIVNIILKKYNPSLDKEMLLYEANAMQYLIKPGDVEIGTTSIRRFKRIMTMYQEMGLIKSGEHSLSDFIYDPLEHNNSYMKYFYIFVIVTLSFLTIIILVLIINHRLKIIVKIKTSELETTNFRLQRYIDLVDEYVISLRVNKDENIIDVSSAFENATGFTSTEIIGTNYHDKLRHPENSQQIYNSIKATILKGKTWKGELKTLKKNGETMWVDAVIKPHITANGIDGFTSFRTDITDKKIVEKLSITDKLTGLNNRLKIDEELNEAFNTYKRYNTPLSILIADIDKFKEINDTFGHLKGDIVLKKTAETIIDSIRETDIAGRWGGEEFLIIMPQTEIKGALKAAEYLRKSIESIRYDFLEKSTISIGIAEMKANTTIEELINQADKALYNAKESGRNKVCCPKH